MKYTTDRQYILQTDQTNQTYYRQIKHVADKLNIPSPQKPRGTSDMPKMAK